MFDNLVLQFKWPALLFKLESVSCSIEPKVRSVEIFIVTACVVIAHIVMAYMVITYVIMAHTVTAWIVVVYVL